MNKYSKEVKKQSAIMREDKQLKRDQVVTNFMGGDSYKVDPISTLKMVTASSIFGEPSYYRDSHFGKKQSSRSVLGGYMTYLTKSDLTRAGLSELAEAILDCQDGRKVEDVMIEAIDNALSYDFGATLAWAGELRTKYYMRLNPQVILVRAAIHPDRKEWTAKNPGEFNKYAQECMFRADDALSGMAYYMFQNEGKEKMPSVLKRAYANKLSSLSRYEIAKYKNAEIGLINGVRICHANSKDIDELMQNGTIEVDENQLTWENLRSAGKSWAEIFTSINMGHMAMLRNIRGFFSEVDDHELLKQFGEKLVKGVKGGKQFPFRYYSAYNAVKADHAISDRKKVMALDYIETCMDASLDNMPKFKGSTAVLTDNSGSAWGTIPSEYGSVTVAIIDNLSAIITAMNSDDGVVYAFGDRLVEFPVSKRRGVLEQLEELNAKAHTCGGSTEGGIWDFFKKAMKEKQHWDNIFIYSDMQAGTGGLYGTHAQCMEYGDKYRTHDEYINVYKLLLDYRKQVNSKANMFSVQTAGYDNNVMPQDTYRCSLLYGWTGKECLFADAMNKIWDEVEQKNQN